MTRTTSLLLVLLVASCVAQQAPPSATPAVVATATQTVAPTPTPTPTPDPRALHIAELERFFAILDRAQLSGDPQQVTALLDPNAPPEFRERELGLAKVAFDRRAAPPQRRVVDFADGTSTPLALETVRAIEVDDQGRTRSVRSFLNNAGATRLSEPPLERLGDLHTRPAEGYLIRYRDLDAAQAEAADAFARDAVASLVARLGEDYRPRRPFTITLAPTTIAGLPPLASGYTNGSDITLLSSASMVVGSGEGSDWAQKVVTHEIAHVLLFARGRGPWLLTEGIPLWLTADRRQPELDRLRASNGIWDIAHLLEGPRDQDEFFAGYAQASSFVSYLAGRYGERAVIVAWEAGRTATVIDDAFRAGFGVSSGTAWADWRAAICPASC